MNSPLSTGTKHYCCLGMYYDVGHSNDCKVNATQLTNCDGTNIPIPTQVIDNALAVSSFMQTNNIKNWKLLDCHSVDFVDRQEIEELKRQMLVESQC